MSWWNSYQENTLEFFPDLCINCKRCTQVCPHQVFKSGNEKTILIQKEACMECGACQVNCPAGAIKVDAGVGCAHAMVKGAITGKENCGCGIDDDGSGCCK